MTKFDFNLTTATTTDTANTATKETNVQLQLFTPETPAETPAETPTETPTEAPKVIRRSVTDPKPITGTDQEFPVTNLDNGLELTLSQLDRLAQIAGLTAQIAEPPAEVDPAIAEALDEKFENLERNRKEVDKISRKLEKDQRRRAGKVEKTLRDKAAAAGLGLVALMRLARESADFVVEMMAKKAKKEQARKLLMAAKLHNVEVDEIDEALDTDAEAWEAIDFASLATMSNKTFNKALKEAKVKVEHDLRVTLKGHAEPNLGTLEESLAYLEHRYDAATVKQRYQELTDEVEDISYPITGYIPEMIQTWITDGAMEVFTRNYASFGGYGERKGWWPTLSEAEKEKRDAEEDYSFPLDALKAEWDAQKPTWIEATSEGAYALWIVGPDGKVLPFGDLGGYELVSTNAKVDEHGVTQYVLGDKVFKREPIKRMGSYLRDRVTIAEYGTPQAQDPSKFVYRILPESGLDHDGVVYISPRLRDHLVARMMERMLDGRSMAELGVRESEKIERLARKASKTISFGNFRMLTEIGLFKGDALVALAETDEMPEGVDILVFEDNLKEEIRYCHPGGLPVGLVSMQTKGQAKPVRSNRQVISFLQDLGYGDNYQEIISAFERQMNLYALQLQRGEYLDPRALDMEPEKDGYIPSFSAVAEMAAGWDAAGLNLADSQFLTGMLAEGIAMANTPDDRQQDRKRRFPVPNGVGSSMHTIAGYELVYGRKCPVGPYEVLFDEGMGWIPGRAVEHLFFGVQGGADRDDRSDAIIGFADADTLFRSPDGKTLWGVKQGQPVALFYRNPLTANSDGIDVSFEFLILKVTGLKVKEDKAGNRAIISPVDGRYGIKQTIPVSRRPLCVAEMEVPEAAFEATPLEMPETLTFSTGWELVKNNRRDPLGRFMNMLMAYSAMGWTWQHVAAGEEVVDACQQLRNPADFVKLEGLINALQMGFLGKLDATRTPIDYWVAKRAGTKVFRFAQNNDLITHDGVFSTLVRKHRETVEDFRAKSSGLAEEARQRVVSAAASIENHDRILGYWRREVLNPAKSVFEAETGSKYVGTDVNEKKRQILGDALAARVKAVAETLDSEERALKLVKAVYVLLHRDETTKTYPAKYMYWGNMFDWTVKALKAFPIQGNDGNGGNGGGSPEPTPPPAPSTPDEQSVPFPDHEPPPADMIDTEAYDHYEQEAPVGEMVDTPPPSPSAEPTCKRRNCEEPRRGTQFCKGHECSVEDCNNGPKAGSVLCGPHDDQAHREWEEEASKSKNSSSQEGPRKTLKVAVIGHRPDKLVGGYGKDMTHFVDCVEQELATIQAKFPEHQLIELCGGAQGGDWIGEEAARNMGLPVHVFQAFDGVDRKWPWQARKHFAELLARAEKVTLVTEDKCTEYDEAVVALFRRNRVMIAESDIVIALWDENPKGGTYNAIRSARDLGKPVVIVKVYKGQVAEVRRDEVKPWVPGCPRIEDLRKLDMCPRLPLVWGDMRHLDGFAEDENGKPTHLHFYREPAQEVLEKFYQRDPDSLSDVVSFSLESETPPPPRVLNRKTDEIPDGAVYIGRGSKWGNIFTHRRDVAEKSGGKVMLVSSRDEAVERYQKYIWNNQELRSHLPELQGRDLVCYCAPQRCHGDVLVAMANPDLF